MTEDQENICNDCGGYGERVLCPYNEEMGGEPRYVVLCPVCEQERRYDV